MQCLEETERMVCQAGRDGYREYRIPGVLSAPDGALLLACEARAENKGDWGDIDLLVLRLSAEGTLEQVLRIGESALPPSGKMRTYHNPVLVPDGESVHLLFHHNYARAFVCSSSDGGKNWGERREITEDYRTFPYEWNVCATGPGHGLQLGDGRLVAPVWLARGEKQNNGLTRAHWPSVAGWVFSGDHGRTWQPGALAEGICNANETSAAQLPDGRLLLNFRNMNESRRRVLGLSSDGKTLDRQWSPAELHDPMCFGGMTAGLGGILFVNCDDREKRQRVTVKRSADGGETWTPLWRVDEQGGYADIACRKNRVYVFYERYSYEKRLVEALVLKTASIKADEEG